MRSTLAGLSDFERYAQGWFADDKGEPNQAAVETLATQPLNRITNVLIPSWPNVSRTALRLPESEVLIENYDGFTLMDGVVIDGDKEPIDIFESADVPKTIDAVAAARVGAFVGYKLSYVLFADSGERAAEVGILVYRFGDEDRAANWIGSLPSRLRSSAARTLNVTELPELGAGSFVATYGDVPDLGLVHQIGAVQAGQNAALVYSPQLDPVTTIGYLKTQVICLLNEGCPRSQTIPTA